MRMQQIYDICRHSKFHEYEDGKHDEMGWRKIDHTIFLTILKTACVVSQWCCNELEETSPITFQYENWMIKSIHNMWIYHWNSDILKKMMYHVVMILWCTLVESMFKKCVFTNSNSLTYFINSLMLNFNMPCDSSMISKSIWEWWCDISNESTFHF